MVKLPAKRSKGVQRRHTRRVMTREGYKDVVVNPSVRKPVKLSGLRALKPRKSSSAPSGLALPAGRKPLAPKTGWRDVLKPDDGSSVPISVRYDPGDDFGFGDVFDLMELMPSRNTDRFIEEVIYPLMDDLTNLIGTDAIRTREDWEKALEDAAVQATRALEESEDEPEAQITYSDGFDDFGLIYPYSAVNADDIDVKWESSDGWRGRTVLDLPSDSRYAELAADGLLFGSDRNEILGAYNDALTRILDERGIEWARVTTRSSNVFFSPVYFVVEKSRLAEAKALNAELEKAYDLADSWDRVTNPFSDHVASSDRSPEEMRRKAEEIADPDVKRMLLEAIERGLGDE